jgi:hypothetical protein
MIVDASKEAPKRLCEIVSKECTARTFTSFFLLELCTVKTFVYVIVPNRIGYICLVAKSFLSNIITSPFNVKLRTCICVSATASHR